MKTKPDYLTWVMANVSQMPDDDDLDPYSCACSVCRDMPTWVTNAPLPPLAQQTGTMWPEEWRLVYQPKPVVNSTTQEVKNESM